MGLFLDYFLDYFWDCFVWDCFFVLCYVFSDCFVLDCFVWDCFVQTRFNHLNKKMKLLLLSESEHTKKPHRKSKKNVQFSKRSRAKHT